MGQTFRKSGTDTQCIPMYGHQMSDVAVFIAHIFMLGYGLEQTVLGYQNGESCAKPLSSWLICQCLIIFLLQIFAPLLLVIPRTPSVLAPLIAVVLFVAQWILLFLGWQWTLAPSNCPTSSPYQYEGAYWLLVVYSLAIPLETVWYIKMYRTLFSSESKHDRLDDV
jgi:hypothetical protein